MQIIYFKMNWRRVKREEFRFNQIIKNYVAIALMDFFGQISAAETVMRQSFNFLLSLQFMFWYQNVMHFLIHSVVWIWYLPCHSKWQFKLRLDRWLVLTTSWGVITLFNFDIERKNVHMAFGVSKKNIQYVLNFFTKIAELILGYYPHIWLTYPIPTRLLVHFKFTKIITRFEMSVAPFFQ